MAEASSPLPPSSSSSSASDLRQRMLHRVISSGLTIKSQQRGEPDLSQKEKVDILSCILLQQPGAFLMRFGKVLDETDLSYFDRHSDYEVVFRLKELRKLLSPRNRQQRVQNRRFECMKELMDTDYFSEEEMRQRNPLLFNYYIGQYLSEEELAALDSATSDMTLSSHIMRKMQLDRRRERLRRQTEKEMEQLEEEDTSSEEEEMEGTAADVTEDEKRRLRQEFLRAMQLSFLRGEDKTFDYSKVDTNEQYDSIETQQQDTEDAYFDEEEPEWCQENRADTTDTSGEEPGRLQR